MGNSDKNEETRRNSLSNSVHNNAPNSSTVKEGCSEKYKNVEIYIKQSFDIVPNGVTLDDAEVILIGEVHSTDPSVRAKQIRIRNTIISTLATPKDIMLFEGMEQKVLIKQGETNPLESEPIVGEICKYYKPVFEKEVLITGWDNMEEQKIFKSCWRERNLITDEYISATEKRKQLLLDMKNPENESQKPQMEQEFERLGKRNKEIREEIEVLKKKIDDTMINRNKCMIECIQKFSRKDNRVFILTGQQHFNFDNPLNGELKQSLQGKKVLYLLEHKREAKEGESSYGEQFINRD